MRAGIEQALIDVEREQVDRYFFEIQGMFHGDFTSFPMIARQFATRIEGRTPDAAARGHQALCEYVLDAANLFRYRDTSFRDAFRKRAEAAGTQVTYRILDGLRPPPTEEQFVELIRRQGLERALQVLADAKAREPNESIVSVPIMTALAYDFVDQGAPALGA